MESGELRYSPKDFERDYRKHHREFNLYAMKLCNRREDIAADMLQSASEGFLRNIKNFDGKNFKAYFYTCLRNAVFSRNRLKSTHSEISTEDSLLSLNPTTRTSEQSLNYSEVRRYLNGVWPEHREALILVKILGLSYLEACEVADCVVGTMKSRVSRAIDSVQDSDDPLSRRYRPEGFTLSDHRAAR